VRLGQRTAGNARDSHLTLIRLRGAIDPKDSIYTPVRRLVFLRLVLLFNWKSNLPLTIPSAGCYKPYNGIGLRDLVLNIAGSSRIRGEGDLRKAGHFLEGLQLCSLADAH